MKKYVPMVALCGLLFSATASAQNPFSSFLDRYKPTRLDLAALETSDSPPAALTSIAQQDGGLPISISDVIRLMLDNNLDIGVNRFSPLTSQYLIDTLFGRFEPTLSLSANISRSTTPSGSQLDGAASNSRLSGNYQATFSQTLKTGSAYSVRFQVNRSSTNSSFSTVNPSYNGSLVYSFQQPLLRNFGRLINTNQIRVARNNLNISEIQFEQQVTDLVTQAHNLYWDLVFAREDIKVQQESLQLAQRTLEDNQKQVEIGTLAPIEVVQAESEVASRREGLVLANYSQIRVEDNIKRLISRVPDPALVLLSLDPTDDVRGRRNDQIIPVAEAIRLALLNRPEMRQIEIQVQNNDFDLEFSRNQLLPQFDITASYTQAGLGGTQNIRDFGGSSVTQIPGGIGGAFSDIFGFDFTGYQVGFSLQIPLSNKSAQASHTRLITQKRLNESRRAATAQAIATEVRDAFNQIEMNRARIEAAQIARELAVRRLDAEQRKFRLGASAIRFVLQEQRNLTQAQTTEIRSLVDYVKALVSYDRAMARTLESNNIQIEQQLRPSIASAGSPGVVGQQ
jgi:outer membrane protein TolC